MTLQTALISSTLITPPAYEPLTLAEARMQLKTDEQTFNDDEILRFIATARDHVEGKLSMALLTQTWEVVYGCDYSNVYFGSSLYAPYCRRIRLPYPPLQSIVSVNSIGSSGTLTLIDPSAYSIGPDGVLTIPYILSAGNVIRFIAGYTNADLIPPTIKHWMLLAIEEMDRNRGLTRDVSNIAISPYADRLLDRYRMLSV